MATRKFKLKIKDKFNQNVTLEHDLDQTKLEEYEIEPVSKSLLIMGGTYQQIYKHSVPKQTKIKELRINLTFIAFAS